MNAMPSLVTHVTHQLRSMAKDAMLGASLKFLVW